MPTTTISPDKTRVSLYLTTSTVRQVRSKLVLEGGGLSEWVEAQMRAYLAKSK